MPSLKSQFINYMIRNRHWFQGKIRKETFDMNTSIPGFRDVCEKGASRFGKIPEGVEVRSEAIAGINCEWLVPSGTDPSKLIFYVHGGGYVSGSCNDHRNIVSKFVLKTGITNLVFEYRLAPEHPFPAGLEDSVKLYLQILSSGYKPEDILIAGESAGGGLCLAILLALKEKGIPMPVAAVAISPWTDLTCSGESYRTKNKKSVAPMNSWTVFSRHYAGGNDLSDPLISPLFGDMKGLPPLFINSGEDDELFDDGRLFAEKAKEAGVDVMFRPGPGMIHCYPLLAPMFPEATEAMEEIVGFVKRKMGIAGQ
jgi:monoterpene epsilon-lactone hydrolase